MTNDKNITRPKEGERQNSIGGIGELKPKPTAPNGGENVSESDKKQK